MRKLALLTTLLCLAAAVPAIALAAEEGEAPGARTGHATVAADAVGAGSAVHEARGKLRLARERATPEPPKPKPVVVPAHLQAIAQCESGGDPTAIGGGGLYRGKYQFSVATWQAVGGKGDPAAAPEAEQDRRAIILYNTSGPGQWPVCNQ